MLELINRGRMDPTAEAQRLGIGLNDNLSPGTINGSAKQPLAFTPTLNISSDAHSTSMLSGNYFSHTGSDGSTVSDRVFAAGWEAAAGSGWTVGENISYRASSANSTGFNASTIESHHNGLFLSAGHRTNLMSDRFSEIGIGQVVGAYTTSSGTTYPFTSMLTQNFADGGRTYITGVVLDDKDNDQFYDIGEGLGSIQVTATSSGGSFSTQTWDAGGYSLNVTAGTYTVTFSGGNLSQTITKQVVVGNDNVKIDAFANVAQGNDSVGTNGNDIFTATSGNDIYNGQNGLDTVVIAASRNQLNVEENDAVVTVTGGSQGNDTFTNVERLQLNDGTLAFDLEGNAGQAFRLYQAVFDRTPDLEGLGYWIRQMDEGNGDQTWVASHFMGSEEFQSIYGTPDTVSNNDFLGLLYQNALGRSPDQGGLNYWTDQLDAGLSRERVVASFSESVENQANVASQIDNGIWFI